MVTRRQHYIWRNYLRPWADNEQIWCLREDKKFKTNIMNIGQQRDFYAVKDEITNDEIEYIAAITRHRHDGVLNEHNSWFVDLYKNVSALHDIKEANDEIANFLIQFEENLMSAIEGGGVEYLNLLLSENTTFFNEEQHRAKFCYFLMIQFVRTKRMSEKIRSVLSAPLAARSINIDSVWAVEKYITAGHMALSLFDDKEYDIYLLKNTTGTPFITSDQPVFNTQAVGIGDSIPTTIEFYYPISPSIAVIISKKNHRNEIDLDGVRRFNSFVKKMSYEQIYANKEELL